MKQELRLFWERKTGERRAGLYADLRTSHKEKNPYKERETSKGVLQNQKSCGMPVQRRDKVS